jgi:hypothetical protein
MPSKFQRLVLAPCKTVFLEFAHFATFFIATNACAVVLYALLVFSDVPCPNRLNRLNDRTDLPDRP